MHTVKIGLKNIFICGIFFKNTDAFQANWFDVREGNLRYDL